MASLLCEHCATPINEKEAIVMREGRSYHIDCHKCFICNEANLSNYESFRGVLFCEICSQKIFDSCKKVHKPSTKKDRRGRREEKIGDRREFRRRRSKEIEELYESTKELIKSFNSKDLKLNNYVDTTIKPAKYKHHRIPPSDEIKSKVNSQEHNIDIGVSTYINNELLDQLRTTTEKHRGDKLATYSCPKMMSAPAVSLDNCDLRVAGIGASTEIASMAFRNNKHNKADTVSLSVTGVDDTDATKSWSQGRSEDTSVNSMEHTIGSLLWKPYEFFKTHILEESSIIEPRQEHRLRESLVFRRFKKYFKEEVIEHQGRGIKKLYPTINRIARPYKLGWLKTASRYSGSLRWNSGTRNSGSIRCRHYRSHSYRCMRAAVMKLAGPTSSELKVLRDNLLKLRAVRNIINFYCGKDCRRIEEDDKSEEV